MFVFSVITCPFVMVAVTVTVYVAPGAAAGAEVV
jgi:hypothetical protein